MQRKPKQNGRPPVNLRRMYVDCRYGQLHLRSAFPSNGGFDELTTLVCLGPGPATSRLFADFLACMGHERSVYAPDLPGFGESDPPPASERAAADLPAAVGDFIDHMRFRQVDLLGYGEGAGLASELALARPERVRRVVLAAPLAELPGGSPLLQQPVLVLRPADAPWEITPRSREGLPGARFLDLPERTAGLFDLAPEVVARHVREFLD